MATFDPPDYRERAKAAGYRSVLSVLVRAREQLFALHFWSQRVAAFSEADVPWRVTSPCMSPLAFRTSSWPRRRVEQAAAARRGRGRLERASRRCPRARPRTRLRPNGG